MKKRIALILMGFVLAILWIWRFSGPTAPPVEVRVQNYVIATYGVTRLQVVEDVTLEKIERREKDSVFWNLIRLPDIVVEVHVPVVTTYYVDLEKGFQIEQTDGHWTFTVPALEFNMPAADVSAVDYRLRQGKFFQRTEEVKQSLEKTLTPLLIQRAEEATLRLKPRAEEKLRDFLSQWVRAQSGTPPLSVTIQWRSELN